MIIETPNMSAIDEFKVIAKLFLDDVQGIQYNNIKYLDSGYFAAAFLVDTKPQSVVKVTSDERDAVVSRFLMDKPHKHAVEIYDIVRFDIVSKDGEFLSSLYPILVQYIPYTFYKAMPTIAAEYDIVNWRFVTNYSYEVSEATKEFTETGDKTPLREIIGLRYKVVTEHMMPFQSRERYPSKIVEYIDAIFSLLFYLLDNGIYMHDVHSKNFGFEDKTFSPKSLKVFDFGLSTFMEEESPKDIDFFEHYHSMIPEYFAIDEEIRQKMARNIPVYNVVRKTKSNPPMQAGLRLIG